MDVAAQKNAVSDMREAVRVEVGAMLADLQKFVDRRIAELSAEVHGAVQLMDYSEANITGQLSRVHEQIVGLIAAPAAATRNSGLELEAVVQATETAANQIMEAAEAIGDWVASGDRDPASVQAVAERLNAIFEACTFQDLTGQRIRRAIEHLQKVETMLGGMIEDSGAKVEEVERMADAAPSAGPLHKVTTSAEGHKTPDLAQTEIDKLLDF